MRLMLLGLCLLAGCASGVAPAFFGAERHDLTLEGHKFAVYLKEDHAEVFRLGYLSRAERDAIPPLMERAAEQASGCAIAGPAAGIYRSPSLPGDTGEARFRLKCKKPKA